jgi:hypothetical protein
LSANQGKTLKGLIDTINILLTSDDTTLDHLQEIVNFIKINKSTLDTLSISGIAGLQNTLDAKVNISDIKDNLTSIDIDKPLSANQGKELKTLVVIIRSEK